MVAAEATFAIPAAEEISLVSQRKYNLDPHRPWWEVAFFRIVWLPVVRFGFKRMHIAAPSAMDSRGRIELIEQRGAFTDRKMAYASCEDEFHSVKQLPLDVQLPRESVQYKGHGLPMSVMPDRYRRRTFPLVVDRAEHLVALQESIAKLGKVAGT